MDHGIMIYSIGLWQIVIWYGMREDMMCLGSDVFVFVCVVDDVVTIYEQIRIFLLMIFQLDNKSH